MSGGHRDGPRGSWGVTGRGAAGLDVVSTGFSAVCGARAERAVMRAGRGDERARTSGASRARGREAAVACAEGGRFHTAGTRAQAGCQHARRGARRAARGPVAPAVVVTACAWPRRRRPPIHPQQLERPLWQRHVAIPSAFPGARILYRRQQRPHFTGRQHHRQDVPLRRPHEIKDRPRAVSRHFGQEANAAAVHDPRAARDLARRDQREEERTPLVFGKRVQRVGPSRAMPRQADHRAMMRHDAPAASSARSRATACCRPSGR